MLSLTEVGYLLHGYERKMLLFMQLGYAEKRSRTSQKQLSKSFGTYIIAEVEICCRVKCKLLLLFQPRQGVVL